MSDHPENDVTGLASVRDAIEEPHPPWRSLRVAGTAVVCLLVFSLAMYAMRAFTAGATVIVEGDEVATVVLETGGVQLEEIDGPLKLTLRPGRNAARAGRFRIVAEVEGVQLEYSTGEVIDLKKNDVLVMKVNSTTIE